jgi:hypothetical protein
MHGGEHNSAKQLQPRDCPPLPLSVQKCTPALPACYRRVPAPQLVLYGVAPPHIIPYHVALFQLSNLDHTSLSQLSTRDSKHQHHDDICHIASVQYQSPSIIHCIPSTSYSCFHPPLPPLPPHHRSFPPGRTKPRRWQWGTAQE